MGDAVCEALIDMKIVGIALDSISHLHFARFLTCFATT